MMESLLIFSFVVVVIVEISCYRKTKHPVRNAVFGIFSGAFVLIPASFVLAHFGVLLSINYMTLITAAMLGIPGVAAMATFLLIS